MALEFVQQFQSLTRDSNHSNTLAWRGNGSVFCFNPSRGIAIIQTAKGAPPVLLHIRFNPSRGIAIIQTPANRTRSSVAGEFQSLTRDSNHSNALSRQSSMTRTGFNPSRGIAIIQTKPSEAQTAR